MSSATNSLRDALAALKREQAKTQKAITAIETLILEIGDEPPPTGSSLTAPLLAPAIPTGQSYIWELGEATPSTSLAPIKGEFAHMTIGDASVAFLRKMGKPQKMNSIIEGIKAGGITSTSRNMYRMLYNILSLRLDRDVSKNGPEWGLTEWERT